MQGGIKLKSMKRQLIKEKFTELYSDHISDIDIEFLYNYIIHTDKLKELYKCARNNVGCYSNLIKV